MNKTARLFVRVSEREKETVEKAAADHKSVAAFLLSCVQTVCRYRRLIEQAKTIEREYKGRGIKTPTLEVRIK
jgi:uncharacterized protein (DUF1778 family)